jgi:SAM-dependent methyltransferase
MARSRFHRILERPAVYRLAQRVLAPGVAELDRAYDELFRESRGRVLDVGSGPRADTPLPVGLIVGVDVNHAYVSQYTGRVDGERADCVKLGVVASGAALPFLDGSFDESRCAAVLHHLPDELAQETIREMARVVRPGGRIIIFDTVWPPSFAAAPFAWLLCRYDRGEWMRSPERVERLARQAFDGAWQAHTVVYSWYRTRGVVLTAKKS